jgi:uncharacterized membrane protein
MSLKARVSLYIFSAFFIIAGINHFVVPDIYLKIIPPYFPYHVFLTYFSGFAEIVLGIFLLFKKTQKLSALGIIILLIALIPAHIYMIQIAPFYLGSIYVNSILAWLRLPIQILLILWAYQYYK